LAHGASLEWAAEPSPPQRQHATSAGDERGFTGQRHDPDTGLIDLHARWYDPALGRFTSPDWFDPIDEASALQGAAIGWLASPVGTNQIHLSDFTHSRSVFGRNPTSDLKRS
jgi:RHS repeat-associated protein